MHKEIIGSAVKTLQAAIEAGQILTEIKGSFPHGEFISWCKDNLPFNTRTAQRYMRCYVLRDQLLKNDTVSLLEAYRLLEKPKEKIDLSTWPLMLKEMKTWLIEDREYLSLIQQAQKTDDPLHCMAALAKNQDINEDLSKKMGDWWKNFQTLLSDSQIKDIKHLSEAVDIARQIQNTCSVIMLYWEIEIGKILNELEERWPEMYQAIIKGDEKKQGELISEIEEKIRKAEAKDDKADD